MCVRKSIISLHRYSHADARKKNIAIASMFKRGREKAALRSARGPKAKRPRLLKGAIAFSYSTKM